MLEEWSRPSWMPGADDSREPLTGKTVTKDNLEGTLPGCDAWTAVDDDKPGNIYGDGIFKKAAKRVKDKEAVYTLCCVKGHNMGNVQLKPSSATYWQEV